jgi:hypothetical protein
MLTLNVMKIAPASVPEGEEVSSVEELALARALEECLDAMELGETDLDRLSGRYPEARDNIQPLLEIAQQLRRRRGLSAPLSLEFQEQLRERLAQQARA